MRPAPSAEDTMTNHDDRQGAGVSCGVRVRLRSTTTVQVASELTGSDRVARLVNSPFVEDKLVDVAK